jgi:hypothetical protein
MALIQSADDRSANNVLRASEAMMEPSNPRALSTVEEQQQNLNVNQLHCGIGWLVKDGHCTTRLTF